MTAADFPRTGIAYIAQIENEHAGSEDDAVCNTCFASGEDKQLRRCTGCKLANYCSRECQKKQWTKHKAFCALVQGKGEKLDYLSSFSENQVFRILIDSYRLRVDNDHKHRGEDHGIYYPGHWIDGSVWVKGDVVEDFQKYLDLAEDSGLLPSWWSFDTRMGCLELAIDKKKGGNICEPVDLTRLLMAYDGDLTSQFALRIIAELIVGYDGKGTPTDDSALHQLEQSLESVEDAKSEDNHDQ